MANEIVVPISIDLDSLKDGLAKAKTISQKSGEEISESVSNGFSSSLKGFGIAIATAFAGLKLAGKVKDIFGDAIQESIEGSSAMSRLNQAMANAGQFSASASADMKSFAETIQSTTTLSDDLVVSLTASSRVFASSNEQTKKLTTAAIELSKATGMDLQSSVDALGKTLSGATGRLSQTIPELRAFTAEQLRAGAAIDTVLSRFGGTAAQEINTFAGRLAQARNSGNSFLETLGDLVTKSPVVAQIINGIGKSFEKLGDFIKGLGPDFIGDLIKSFLSFGQAIITYVVSPIEFAINIGKLLFSSIKFSLQGVVMFFTTIPALIGEYLVGPFLKWAATLPTIIELFDSELASKLKEKVDSLGQSFIDSSKNVRETVSETQGVFRDELNQSAQALTDFPMSTMLSSRLGELQTFVDQAKPITEQFKNNTITALTATQLAAIEMGKKFNETLNSGLVQGVARAVSGMAQSLAKGQLSFASFTKMMLGIAGDLAIQLGTVLLGTGFGIEALKSLGGTAAIAAGLGLIAVGGIMKALGDGGGAGGPAGSAGTFTGSGVGPISETTTLPELEAQKPGATINLTVQGNIMDRRQAGLELVEVLNEAFGSSGLTVQGAV